MTLQDAIAKAQAADDAFSVAYRAAGYGSRWDIGPIPEQGEALRNAYFVKIVADAAMGRAFEAARNGTP